MECNCTNEISEKMIAKYRKEKLISTKVSTRTFFNIILTLEASGQKIEEFVAPSFCPFCGSKTEKQIARELKELVKSKVPTIEELQAEQERIDNELAKQGIKEVEA